MKESNKKPDHIFSYRQVEKNRLLISLLITIIVLFIEILGALLANSIALLSDAGHMFTVTKNLDICGQPQTPLY